MVVISPYMVNALPLDVLRHMTSFLPHHDCSVIKLCIACPEIMRPCMSDAVHAAMSLPSGSVGLLRHYWVLRALYDGDIDEDTARRVATFTLERQIGRAHV